MRYVKRRSPHGLFALLSLVPTLALAIQGANGITAGLSQFKDARDQFTPAAAFDGKGTFLVVWQQGTGHVGRPGGDILALRINASGRLLDSEPLRVCTVSGSQEKPKVAFANGRFVVVWQDFRNGRDWDVYYSRVTSQGQVLDPGGRLLAGGRHNQAVPILAADGSRTLVVWLGYGADGFYQLHGALIGADGHMKFRQPLKISTNAASQWYGYTPGWGYGRSPLAHNADPRIVRGGNAAVTALAQHWLLSWNDETNWRPGGRGMRTRRFARLTLDTDGKIHVDDINREPLNLSMRSTGQFAADADQAFYVDLIKQGRGLGRQLAVGIRFSAASAKPLSNANSDPKHGLGSAWNPARATLIFGTTQISGPLAVAYAKQRYLVIAAGRAESGPPAADQLLGAWFNPRGRRLTDPRHPLVIYKGNKPPANPTLATGNGSFLAAFEQDDPDGIRRIHVMLIRVPQ
jgi:hypothetical protein